MDNYHDLSDLSLQGKAVSDWNVYIAANKTVRKYTSYNVHEGTDITKEFDKSSKARKRLAKSRLDRLDRCIEVRNACDCFDMENSEPFKKSCNTVEISPTIYSYLINTLSRNEPVLNLRNLGIGPTGAYAVTHRLMKSKSAIRELDISSNNLEDRGTATFCTFLATNCTVLKVNFSKNCFGKAGANAIASMLAVNKKLKMLVLSHNGLSEDNFELVASELHTDKTLENLDLSSNSFSSRCGYIFSCLFAKNISLVTLNLSCNYIGDEGMRDIVPGLKQNKTIRSLDLSWNKIGNDGTAWIAEFLTSNNVLKRLNLGYNGVATKGIKCLTESLTTNGSLEFLELSGNSLLSQDAVVLLEGILRNSTLKLTRLYLGEVAICPESNRLFQEIHNRCQRFEVFGMVDAVGQAIKLGPQKNALAELDRYISNNKLSRRVSFVD